VRPRRGAQRRRTCRLPSREPLRAAVHRSRPRSEAAARSFRSVLRTGRRAGGVRAGRHARRVRPPEPCDRPCRRRPGLPARTSRRAAHRSPLPAPRTAIDARSAVHPRPERVRVRTCRGRRPARTSTDASRTRAWAGDLAPPSPRSHRSGPPRRSRPSPTDRAAAWSSSPPQRGMHRARAPLPSEAARAATRMRAQAEAASPRAGPPRRPWRTSRPRRRSSRHLWRPDARARATGGPSASPRPERAMRTQGSGQPSFARFLAPVAYRPTTCVSSARSVRMVRRYPCHRASSSPAPSSAKPSRSSLS
jgi:hypothetical protein